MRVVARTPRWCSNRPPTAASKSRRQSSTPLVSYEKKGALRYMYTVETQYRKMGGTYVYIHIPTCTSIFVISACILYDYTQCIWCTSTFNAILEYPFICTCMYVLYVLTTGTQHACTSLQEAHSMHVHVYKRHTACMYMFTRGTQHACTCLQEAHSMHVHVYKRHTACMYGVRCFSTNI